MRFLIFEKKLVARAKRALLEIGKKRESEAKA